MVRSLQAELVDALPPEHPGAIETRRDLRRINTLMGHIGILTRALDFVAKGRFSANNPRHGNGMPFPLPLSTNPETSIRLRSEATARQDIEHRTSNIERGFPLSPEHHLTPALSPTSWRRGRGSRARLRFTVPMRLRPRSANLETSEAFHVIELGAGDGELLLRVARRRANKWKDVDITFVDLQDLLRDETKASFATLGWQAQSVRSDALQWMLDTLGEKADVIVANLFLHHFSDAQLSELFLAAARKADAFIALEPRRSPWPLFCARLLALIGFGPVTCHDAPISVRAGFAGTELSVLWPQDGTWQLAERRAGLFSHLFVARRKV